MKLELVNLCKEKAKANENEKKAIEYSRAVRKRERRKNVLYTICAIFIFFAIGIVGNNDLEILAAQGKTTTDPIVESKEIVSEENFYVICDVDEVEVGSNGETILVVIMQDGSIHNYEITDALEGYVYEVCFKANDLDDFSSYEVVALR